MSFYVRISVRRFLQMLWKSSYRDVTVVLVAIPPGAVLHGCHADSPFAPPIVGVEFTRILQSLSVRRGLQEPFRQVGNGAVVDSLSGDHRITILVKVESFHVDRNFVERLGNVFHDVLDKKDWLGTPCKKQEKSIRDCRENEWKSDSRQKRTFDVKFNPKLLRLIHWCVNWLFNPLFGRLIDWLTD